MNNVAQGEWRAFSAGSAPVGAPNPYALKTLEQQGYAICTGDAGPPRSKSWDEFARDDAPIMDMVVTVCDNAAGEVCPIWPVAPGATPPRKRHWGFPDPAAAAGTEADKLQAFADVFQEIKKKIDQFLKAEK